MNNDQLEAMLTARQVAEFLQVSISTVRRWSDRGLLKYYRIGSRGDRRYRREDVMRFIQRSSRVSRMEDLERDMISHIERGTPQPRAKSRREKRRHAGAR
jgi:excisionase family DNA binding protein